MSTTYVAVIVSLLATFLPKLGVSAGSDELTAIVQGAVALGSGVWILYKRFKQGDVSLAGLRK